MTKSKTKTKPKATTKSSKLKVVTPTLPKLDKISKDAITLLTSLTTMEFLQYAGPAIRDLGIYNMDEWSGGFDSLYKEIFNTMFDGRELRAFLCPTLIELRKESTCGSDSKMLAATLARVGAVYTFVCISNDRNLVK